MSTPCKHPALLTAIVAHCAATGVSESAFGRAAVNDPGLVAGIRAGRELRRMTIARIRVFMEPDEVSADRGAA
jgi:hypothetical protein